MVSLVFQRFIGVDVGLSGAAAALDVSGGVPVGLTIHDLPVLRSKTAKAKGKAVIDVAGLLRMFDLLHLPALTDGASVRVTLEMVSAMPGQGVASMFSFGRSLGAVETAIAAARLPVDPVRANEWKRALRVPVAEQGIIARADQLLPGHAHLWRGPRGGLMDGRAEAALLAFYGWHSSTGAAIP